VRQVWIVIIAEIAASCSPGATDTVSSGLSAPEVTTASGVLEGSILVQDGVTQLPRIPYARPPIGNRRWAAATTAEQLVWRPLREQFSPSCHSSLFVVAGSGRPRAFGNQVRLPFI